MNRPLWEAGKIGIAIIGLQIADSSQPYDAARKLINRIVDEYEVELASLRTKNAAAPDLLAACEAITLLADPALYGAPQDIRAKYVEFHNKVQAAVAKAKGQAA